jgi:hypothetical protein
VDYVADLNDLAAAIQDLSSALTFFLKEEKHEEDSAAKSDFTLKTKALFILLKVDEANSQKGASYVTDVVEAVAGGSTAAKDVLNDITTLASTHNVNLPPMLVGMLSGLLTQAEVAIQQYHSGK